MPKRHWGQEWGLGSELKPATPYFVYMSLFKNHWDLLFGKLHTFDPFYMSLLWRSLLLFVDFQG